MTLRSLRIYALADPVELRGRFAIGRLGTILRARAASDRDCSDWSVQRRAACIAQDDDEVMRSLARKSSMQLAREYKSSAKERILYQQRVADTLSELKITIWVTRRLLIESFELMKRLDASL
jgi:hypothetical protein